MYAKEPLQEEPGRLRPKARPRLLTIGGCNTIEIGRRLAFACEHDHFWNVTWASLGSDPFPDIELPPDSYFDMWRGYVERECRKTGARRIAESGYDVILLSDGLQVLNDYVELGSSCLSDFTSERYITDDDLAGAARPSIRSLVGSEPRLVKWSDPGFVDFIVAAFGRLYERVLTPVIARGAKIVMHHHVFAPETLSLEGVAPAPEPDYQALSSLVDAIGGRIEGFAGVAWIRPSPALNFTSAAAPYGASMTHPIEEQYAFLAAKLASLTGIASEDAVFERHLLGAHKVRLELDAEKAENERLRTALERAEQRARAQADAARTFSKTAADARMQLDDLRRSMSWRITAPLRAVRRLLGAGGSAIPKPP